MPLKFRIRHIFKPNVMALIKTLNKIGLDPSLVKKIIERYNGEIWVEDRVLEDHSKGSKFVILIPEIQ